jgi:predicted O-methyltransferase YrrM
MFSRRASPKEANVQFTQRLDRLYRKYATDLRRVRQDQLRLYEEGSRPRSESFAPIQAVEVTLQALGVPARGARRFKPQLDDIEAEATYLFLRELRPRSVVEISPDRGWSTTWILAALRDNGIGRLYSYDLFDHSTRNIPRDLSQGRWTFMQGDVTRGIDRLPEKIDYLFIDSSHTAEFARWYLCEVFPRLVPGTPVCIHDIFLDRAHVVRFGEARVVERWLAERGVRFFTPSPTAAPDVYGRLMRLKHELGMAEPIHASSRNPMVFFRLPRFASVRRTDPDRGARGMGRRSGAIPAGSGGVIMPPAQPLWMR